MSQTANQSRTSLDQFSITRHAVDERADGASRTVHLSVSAVTIERIVSGVRMRVGVPVSAYRDLAITVRALTGRATLTLRHGDSELDVVIGIGEAVEVAKTARAWSAVLGKPVAIEAACIDMNAALPRRRRGRAVASRRSRFSRRRQLGVESRMSTFFGDEHEIIARN